MPELPEVEATRRALTAWTRGAAIADVDVRDPAVVRQSLSTRPADRDPHGAGRLARLVGARTSDVRRHGKRLAWRFRDREDGLLLHLGMTGRWLRRTAGDAPPSQVRLVLGLDDATAVWFQDPRRFGCVVPCRAGELDSALADDLGPDALGDPPDAATLRERLGRRRLKVALMDQAAIAGIGNIHAAEILWRCKLHPSRRADTLRPGELRRLAAEIPRRLAEHLGTIGDEITYVSAGGPNPFAVYDRAGEPCPRCATRLVARRHAGRSTVYCPRCQRPAR